MFDGVFYLGDVWLDGTYLGDTEGYFFPHEFDVTDTLAAGHEHLLAVEVACARQSDRTAKRNITGVFQHWDCLDPDWNPGGIWRPVRIERTGPVRMTRLRALCREADATRAIRLVRRRPRRRRGPNGDVAHVGSRGCRVERRAVTRRGRQPSRVDSFVSTTPPSGGRMRSGRSRCTTSSSRCRSATR